MVTEYHASPSSVFAELLTNTMSPMCMLWQTSPAATELEEKIIDWLKIALGLSKDFQGVIQDSATSTTLSAVKMVDALPLIEATLPPVFT